MRVVEELEFAECIQRVLYEDRLRLDAVGCVTGPGRSGAIAAVYASHILGVPFIPYGQKAPRELGRLLIVDTASLTGKTMRKARKKYEDETPMWLVIYDEKDAGIGRVSFWYEAPKPQRYRHENKPRRIVDRTSV